MARFLITGGSKLEGEIHVSGNKNSVLPCLAVSLLTDGEVILNNVPNIVDVEVALDILKNLGAEVSFIDHQAKVKVSKLTSHILPPDLVAKLRASILFVGPLLSRLGKAEFSHPGGDVIGVRTIEPHLEGLKSLGFKIRSGDHRYTLSKNTEMKNVEIFLGEASCTATENLIMASVLGKTKVTIKNCATEPQIADVCNMLLQMGANIEGVGSSTLIIEGVERLRGVSFDISPDYIEMATYAIAAAITHGEIKIHGCDLDSMESILLPLERMGVSIKQSNDTVVASARRLVAIPKLHTNIWPGFPTDLMSAVIVLATQARGVSLLHDWMYESRMFFVDKLISMGANITIADPHRVLVSGPTRLRGRQMESPDIRAGMALVLAALVAKGESIINRAELIGRGYEDVVSNLSKLGAKIEQV